MSRKNHKKKKQSDGTILGVEERLVMLLQVARRGSGNDIGEVALQPASWKFSDVIRSIAEASHQFPPEVRNTYLPYMVRLSRFLAVRVMWGGQERHCASEPLSVSVPYYFGRIVGPFEAAQLLPQIANDPAFAGCERYLFTHNGGVMPLRAGDDIEVFPDIDDPRVAAGEILRQAKLSEMQPGQEEIVPEPEPEGQKPQATPEQVRDALVEASVIVAEREQRAQGQNSSPHTPLITPADVAAIDQQLDEHGHVEFMPHAAPDLCADMSVACDGGGGGD